MKDCANCTDCAFDVSKPAVPSDFHEIHVTVKTNQVPLFSRTCSEFNIKPIVIAFQDQHTGKNSTDVMTSHKFRGTNQEAWNECQRVSRLLTVRGFDVTREKIETTPTNPVWQDGKGYFESHLAVTLVEDDIPELREVVKYHFPLLHASRNSFKVVQAMTTLMLTYRASGGSPETFQDEVDAYRGALVAAGYDVDKVIVEYAWYDTNQAHDNGWLGI